MISLPINSSIGESWWQDLETTSDRFYKDYICTVTQIGFSISELFKGGTNSQ